MQMVVILVPVLFGLMGFAVDLGRLYMIKGELKAAADAAALSAAAQIIGTETSTTAAIAAARLTIETATGYGNKYDFAGNPIGETTGSLVSEMPDPTFYETVAGATGTTAVDARQPGLAGQEVHRQQPVVQARPGLNMLAGAGARG